LPVPAGPQREDHVAVAQGPQIGGLHRRAWRYQSPLRAHCGAVLAETIEQVAVAARAPRHAQHRVDVVAVDGLAMLQPLIERVQGIACRIDGLARTGDRQLITARHQGNAELLFDARQVLVVFAEQHR
jgi:hypothetical protein